MPGDGVKIGDAYIDVDADLDSRALRSSARRTMAAIDTDIGRAWRDITQRGVAQNLRIQRNGLMQQIKMAQDAEARYQAFRAQSILENERSIVREQNKIHTAGLRVRTLMERLARRQVHVEVDRDSNIIGRTIGRNISNGMQAVISILPARLEQIFTRTGGLIGTALVAAMATSIAIALPALGAMISGALFASIGFGAAIAAAIVGAIKDPRVSSAITRLQKKFMDVTVLAPGVQFLGQVLAKQIDKVTVALGRWAPHIQGILKAGAKFMPGIFDTMIGSLDRLLPVLNKVANSPFVASLMDIANKGILKIFDAIGVSLERFLKDPEAMKGAQKGLEDFFDLIAGGIKLIFDFIRVLSEFWNKLNTPDKSGKSPIDKMRLAWKNIKEILDAIAASTIGPVIEMLVGLFKKLVGDDGKSGPLPKMMYWFGKFSEWLKDPQNQERIGELVKLLVALKIAALGYSLALKAATLSQKAFVLAGGTGMMGKGGVKAGARGGATGGIASFLLGGSAGQTAGATAGGIAGGPIGALLGAGVGTLMEKLISPAQKERINQEFRDLADGNFQSFWEKLKQDWDHADWSRFGKNLHVQEIWGWFKNGWVKLSKDTWVDITAWFSKVKTSFVTDFLNPIKGVWNTSWAWIRDRLGGYLENIKTWVNDKIGWVRDRIGGILQTIKGWWNTGWAWVRDRLGGYLENIKTWTNEKISWVRDRIGGILETIKGWWNTGWSWIRDRLGGILETVKTWVNEKMSWVRDRINGILEMIKAQWNEKWGWVKDKFGGILETIKIYAHTGITWVKDRIAGILAQIGKGWQTFWDGTVRFFKNIWSQVAQHATNGLNWVIDIINAGAGMINAALRKIGIGWQIPKIDKIGGVRGIADLAQNKPNKNRAMGGRIYGPGTETSDSIPINASRDEFMIRAKSAKRVGYRALEHINMFGRIPPAGYASGGRVGRNNNALLEQHRNHVHVAMGGPRMSWPQIVTAAKRSGIPFRVGSTYRPGSRGNGGGLDHHSEGRAVDFPGFNQDALATYFSHLQGVIELIHRTDIRDYAIFGGKGGGGGILSGIFQWLGKGWNWLVDHLWKPAKNKALNLFGGAKDNGPAIPAGGWGWLNKATDAMLDKIKVEFDDAKAAMDSGAAGNVGGGGSGKWSGVAATALKMLGLPANWLGPLLRLIGRESGGNPNAINRWDSNARAGHPSMGLMQTIGPTFNAYKYPGYNQILRPLDNILAGLRYIKSRYGSIFNLGTGGYALGGRIRPGGYDYGGMLAAGGVAVNMTRKPEMVLTPGQSEALRDRIAGGNGSYDIEVNIHKDYYEAVLTQQGQELYRRVKSGRRVDY